MIRGEEVEMDKRPKKVQLAFEKAKMKWSWNNKKLHV